MIIAVTGHRSFEEQEWTGADFATILDDFRPSTVLTGMAIGFDQWVAEFCAIVGQSYTACIPFVGQQSVWPPHVQYEWEQLMTRAFHVVVVHPGQYAPWKMHERNKFMVDRCDLLVAYYDGSAGGTQHCIEYAKQTGTEVINLYGGAA